MEHDIKRAVMLLKSLIFHYHGLDDDELRLLQAAAKRLKAEEELQWANAFIADEYMSAFERSREFLSKTLGRTEKEFRLKQLADVWEENHQKGYVTEMETTAMLNLAKDLNVERDLIKVINR